MGHPALRPPGWPPPFGLAQNTKFIRRGGIYPARGAWCCRKVPGTMRASSPTWVCNHARAVVSRLAAGLAMGRRGGFHIRPRNPCAAVRSGGMRASRPTSARVAAAFPFGRTFAAVCRGGPWPSRGALRRRKHPGTMQASSPTWVCNGRGDCIFPGGRRVCSGPVGRAFTPAAPRQFQNRGVRAAAKPGGMRASRPTSARAAAAIRVGPKHKIYS